MLEEFKDIFRKEMSEGLPLIREVEYQIDFMLGYVVGQHQRQLGCEKISWINKCFVKDFSTILAPLNVIVKKDVGFRWEESQEREGHPIAYFSEKLINAQINFSTYDKKLYPLIRVLHFVIHNYHEALKHLRGQNNINKRHAKWAEFLEQFQHVIKHKQRKANILADALSRRHSFLSLLETKFLGFEHIKELYLKYDFSKEIYELCATTTNGDFYIHDGTKNCVPKSSIRELLVKEAHKGGLLRHFGEYKNHKTLLQHFFWPHMNRDVHNIYDKGLVCMFVEAKLKPHGFYTPLLIPTMPWVDLSMDFVLVLPWSRSRKDSMILCGRPYLKT
ncbi:Tf2-8, partial [Mucuna pruriens]